MLFRKDIEPRCAYCAQGVRINETQVACVKKGHCVGGESLLPLPV